MSTAIAAALIVAALACAPGVADAARVDGTLTGYENSNPLPSRDLHFENEITGDTYLSPTHSTGSFAANLPSGLYTLRTETGAVLKRNIRVGSKPVSLGGVSELAPYAPARLFEWQAVAPSILTSPAPSTAYIMTLDRTVPPPGAPVVPKPRINWNRLPAGTQASAGGENVATGAPSDEPVARSQTPAGANASAADGRVVAGPTAGQTGSGAAFPLVDNIGPSAQ